MTLPSALLGSGFGASHAEALVAEGRAVLAPSLRAPERQAGKAALSFPSFHGKAVRLGVVSSSFLARHGALRLQDSQLKPFQRQSDMRSQGFTTFPSLPPMAEVPALQGNLRLEQGQWRAPQWQPAGAYGACAGLPACGGGFAGCGACCGGATCSGCHACGGCHAGGSAAGSGCGCGQLWGQGHSAPPSWPPAHHFQGPPNGRPRSRSRGRTQVGELV